MRMNIEEVKKLKENITECEDAGKCKVFNKDGTMFCSRARYCKRTINLIDTIEAQQQEIDRLNYTLLGVMHSVDKWFDTAPKNMDEVNRAAQAREIALQAIEALTADKDEQAGRLMRYDELLKAARSRLPNIGHLCVCGKCKTCGKQIGYTSHLYCDDCLAAAIDALLGGGSDV